MQTLHRIPGKQSGFSLIEFAIASVIGLVILSGAVTVFSSNSASSKMSTGMARVQDNGRVALDMLSNSVRMAGYEGCRDGVKDPIVVLASARPTINTANIAYPDNAVWGSEVDTAWDPTVDPDLAGIQNLVRQGTDVLYVKHGSGRSINLAADMTSGAAALVLPSNPDQFAPNDLLLVSDCTTSNMFRATSVTANVAGQTSIGHNTSLNSQANFTSVFAGTGNIENVAVRVMRFESTAFFIMDSDRDMPNGDPIFSLFALDTAARPVGQPTELIEGVENMQILYGENLQTDSNAADDIRYVTANNVTDWANVVSIQIGLLIATADYAASSNDSRTYNIAGTTIGPPSVTTTDAQHQGDRRLRAAFNTTIVVRNRLL